MAVKSFYLDCKKSRDFGILIDTAKPYGAPNLDVNQISVPGRDGDVFVSNERYTNYDVIYPCGIMGNIPEKMRKIKSWLYGKKGYRKLCDEYTGMDYFRWAFFNSQIEPEVEGDLATFDITFSCKPYLYSFEGQKYKKVNNNTVLFNPEGFASRPLLKIYTQMSLPSNDIYINHTHLALDISESDKTIIIDTETQNAYFYNDGSYTNANHIINTADIELKTEANTFSVGSGLELEIMPRWRTL